MLLATKRRKQKNKRERRERGEREREKQYNNSFTALSSVHFDRFAHVCKLAHVYAFTHVGKLYSIRKFFTFASANLDLHTCKAYSCANPVMYTLNQIFAIRSYYHRSNFVTCLY